MSAAQAQPKPNDSQSSLALTQIIFAVKAPQLRAILRVLVSHYPCGVEGCVFKERLYWISPTVLKAQMWHLRQRLRPLGWTISNAQGNHTWRLERADQ